MIWEFGTLVGMTLLLVALYAAFRQRKAPRKGVGRSPNAGLNDTSQVTIHWSTIPSAHIDSRPAKRVKNPHDIKWFGKGSVLKVGGITLTSPCVYASSGAYSNHQWASDPSEIIVEAPVKKPAASVPEMGYWPWYSRLDQENRFEYLSWLASGRKTLPACEGYLFLYFYGIERRLLLDEADRRWGLQEIVRLRKLDSHRVGTRDGRSFRGYSTGLLWFEIAKTPNRFDDKAIDVVAQLTERWTPELLTAPLAWLVAGERPMPAAIAKHVAAVQPNAQRSVVTKRIPEEFDELFQTRYHEMYGAGGMTLKVSKRSEWQTYRPASGGLEEMRVKIPNPLGIRSQFKKLPDIWNSCIADLRKLSRVAASVDGSELTVDSWEAMPLELRANVDHPLTDSIAGILSELSVSDGIVDDDKNDSTTAMVNAGRFAELLGIDRRPKLTAIQSRKVASTIQYTGYGLVPDARMTSVRYGWDDLVAVVPGLDGDNTDSSNYNAAACVLRLGLSIALADGEADRVELRMLADHIDAVFDLSPDDCLRISALRDLLLNTGSDIRPIAKKIEQMLQPDARRKVGRLMVVIAAATNGIDRSERAALRKAFRALDLAPELLEETISEVLPDADQSEVTVKPANKKGRSGELIPDCNDRDGFRLNHVAISSIMSETREVSMMLANAMGAVDAEAAAVPDIGGAHSEGAVAIQVVDNDTTSRIIPIGPGGRYEALFIALIGCDRWEREKADELARSHGLMLDAGVETINDWSYEALGGPLIEDEDEVLLVDRSLLNDRK